MKILVLTLEYPPQIGGIASYTYNIAKHMPSGEVVVYAPHMKGEEEFDKKRPWKTIRGNPYFTFIWPRWLRLLWHVLEIVKKERIDHIYVHHSLPCGYVAYIINKFKHIPYTIFFHGTDLLMGVKNKKNKLRNVCAAADKIIVNSVFLQRQFESHFEDLHKDVRVVYPCPDEIFLERAPEPELKKLKSQLALEGKKVIVTVARMSEGKGFPHLIRLLPKILEKVPNLVWVIIGDGPKKEEILAAISKNYLQNVTRFIGLVPYAQLPKFYQIADLFVLLTHPDENMREAWGTSFIEAAASGIPAVAGRSGGVEESVENLVTGLVVDVYQDQSIVSAISDLLLESNYAKQMGVAARERVEREFVWHKQLSKIQ